MKDDANIAASPRWVRLFRSASCIALAGVVSWRGTIYEDPHLSAAMPYAMCQLTSITLGLLVFMALLSEPEAGPS